MDPRVERLAKLIVHKSVGVKPGHNVAIALEDDGEDLVEALVKEINEIGAHPFVMLERSRFRRARLLGSTKEQLSIDAKRDVDFLAQMDDYIGIEAPSNLNEEAQVPQEKKALYSKAYGEPVWAAVMKTNWLTMSYPNLGFAQNAGMSLPEFEDYFFKLMEMDYDKLQKASLGLAKRMQEADVVQIIAPDTDLTVSLKGFTAIPSSCIRNLPGGEVASTPALLSANGHIHFNIPSFWNGFLFDDIRLEFKDGKVVDATANNTERFLKEISGDEGSRYIGEFSFGTNPNVIRPMNSILFDEKMAQSMHLALGGCNLFPGRDNGNRSCIHWDLIQSHRPEYGGGEVWIDGELIRKDGLYVVDDCKPLNPEEYFKQI